MKYHFLSICVVIHKHFEIVLELLDIDRHIHTHPKNTDFDGFSVVLFFQK